MTDNAAITARLELGKKRLNLNDDHYRLDNDFVPVGLNAVFDVNSGSSANTSGGGELNGVKYEDREGWSFGIQVHGASAAEVETNLRRLTRFLSQFDQRDPLYLAYKGDDLPEPVYGFFGACSRYEIVTATWGKIGGYYEHGETRKRYVILPVRLRVKPAKKGPRTLLATARGAILPDLLGSSDGLPRGWRSWLAQTNYVTNPVFGNSTYTTGWSIGSSLITYKNSNREFVYPGSPASVYAVSAAATNNTLSTSVTVPVGSGADVIFEMILKVADGGDITATDATLNISGSSNTTVYYPLGDGYWALQNRFATTGAPVTVDVKLKTTGRGFYICAALVMDATAYNAAVPIFWGDNLGCSWSGTAHASTSIGTVGLLSLPALPSTINLGGGAIFTSIKMEAETASLPAFDPVFIAYTSSDGIQLKIQNSGGLDSNIVLTDGQGHDATITKVIANGDVFRIVASWGQNGLALYVNEDTATNATYIAHSDATLYLLSSNTGASDNKLPGVLIDFATYGELSAAEAQAIIRHAQQNAAGSLPASGLMFTWVKDGNAQGERMIYAYGDGSSMHAVLAGIPGDMPPQMSLYIKPPAAELTYWIARAAVAYDEYVQPLGQWLYDLSGTTTTDADMGSAVKTQAVTTSPAYIALTPYRNRLLTGKTHWFARLSSSAANLKAQVGFRFSGSSSSVLGKVKSLTTDTNRRLYYLGNIGFDLPETIDPDLGDLENLTPLLKLYRSTGSGDVLLDYLLLVNGPVMAMTMVSLSTGDRILVKDNQAVGLGGTLRNILDYADSDGDPFELVPNAYNILWWLTGADGAITGVSQLTELTEIYAEPRWSLL
jgi:hypothetical protein